MSEHRESDTEAFAKRLDQIEDGLREAIRREVARLRRLGLPVYVADNGRVVERPEAGSGGADS